MDLLDLLDRRDRPDTGLFWADGRQSWAQVWSDATSVQAYVQSHGGSAAAILTNGPQTPAVLLGCLRAGGVVASLPLPPRQESPVEYAARLEALCADAGIDLLLVDAPIAALLPPLSTLHVASFTTALSCSAAAAKDVPCGRLVQFTSGTSAASKGVALTGAQLAMNIVATLEVIDPCERFQACSWLPLSHDMGLVGMLLNPWATSGGTLLRDPTEFLADPLVWLDDLTRRRAHVTAVPTFALEMVARRLERAKPRNWDLSGLRTLIVGAEPISTDVLQRFAAALAPYGLMPGTLSPAYGLAEAVLAVSMSPPGERWRAAVPTGTGWSLVDGAAARDAAALVACGRPLRSYDVTVVDHRLHIDGPAVMHGYLGHAPRSGPHDTRDEGVIVDGEVVVVGRRDDTLFVRGRKLQPTDVERACGDLARPGTAAAVPDPEGTFTVVVEPADPERIDRAAAAALRAAVSKSVGLAPSRVVFLHKGASLKTTSGKIQRRRTGQWLVEGRLDIAADHRTVRDGGA